MFISAKLYSADGETLVTTVSGVQFNESSGRCTPAIRYKGLNYLLFEGDTYANMNPLNPPVYRQIHTQNL